MFLCFSVDEQTVTRTDTVTGLVNESVDYLGLSFTFKSEGIWDNLDKKIEFYNGEIGVYDLELDNEDKVIVPFEVLTGDYFIFSLYGVSGDLRVTTNRVKVYLKESGFIGDGVAPSDDKRTVIERINDRIDEVSSDVDALETTVSGHSTALSTLGDDVTGLTGSVSALSTNVNAIGDDVDSLETVVNGHTNSINSLTGDVNRIDGTVTDLTGTVNDHSNMLSTHDNSITQLRSDLTGVDNYGAETRERLVTVEEDLSTTQ
jgi:archaellum component FlaC